MKKRKLFAACLALLILLQLFTGCSTASRYKAILYSHTIEWIDKAFLKENRVKNAFYLNESYTEENRYDGVSKWIKDKDSPQSRTYILTTHEEYKSIFSGSPIEVDFEEKMVVLYMFSDSVSSYRKFDIKEMVMTDGVLTVKVKRESGDPDILDSVMPYPRCFMLEMKKLEIKKVIFKEIGYNKQEVILE